MNEIEPGLDGLEDQLDQQTAQLVTDYKERSKDKKRRSRFVGSLSSRWRGQPNGRPHHMPMSERTQAHRTTAGG